MKTDPIKRALDLRKTLVRKTEQGKELLVVDFTDTLQGKDTSKVVDLMPNPQGNYIIRSKYFVKSIDPLAYGQYDREFFDVGSKSEKEIYDFIKRQEFDFPTWFKHEEGFSPRRVCDYNSPLVLQVAGCNFHDGSETGGCLYCFVDDASNDGCFSPGKIYIDIQDTVSAMKEAQERIGGIYEERGYDIVPKAIRMSGGEPTIALDWITDFWKEIKRQNLDFVGEMDCNLSTGRVVDHFEREGVFEEGLLEELARVQPLKIKAAIKGTDDRNMQENVQSKTTMNDQLYSLKKLIDAGFDVYPQMYNPNPLTLEDYLRRMDEEIENFSLRVHIGPLKVYGPTRQRLAYHARKMSENLPKYTRLGIIGPELLEVIEGRIVVDTDKYIQMVQDRWDANYKNGVKIIDNYLQREYEVGYKDTLRADVSLRMA
jgi:uncharacterized Fe-S cluster-containing radical SAM superfamily protein